MSLNLAGTTVLDIGADKDVHCFWLSRAGEKSGDQAGRSQAPREKLFRLSDTRASTAAWNCLLDLLVCVRIRCS
jgi:hypothetical protein